MSTETQAPSRAPALSTTLQFAQLTVMCIAVATAAISIGGRNAELAQATTQIGELRSIVADLARILGSQSTMDATHSAQIAAIDKRLDKLERHE